MYKYLDFEIVDDRIVRTGERLNVIANSYGYVKARIKYPSNWIGAKSVVFANSDVSVKVEFVDDECFIPAEVLTPGVFYVTAHCVDGETRRVTADDEKVYVLPSGPLDGDNAQPITPTDKEQMEATIAELKESIKNGMFSDIVVDDELSETSENPVQNKIIAGVLKDIERAFDEIILRQKAQLEPTDDNENTSIIGVGIIGKMIIGG